MKNSIFQQLKKKRDFRRAEYLVESSVLGLHLRKTQSATLKETFEWTPTRQERCAAPKLGRHRVPLFELRSAISWCCKNSSISKSYARNKFAMESMLTLLLKKSRFCNGHFSPVSTNFWILSSRIGRPECALASKLANVRKFDEKNIEKSAAKPENSNFVDFFRPRKQKLFFIKKTFWLNLEGF